MDEQVAQVKQAIDCGIDGYVIDLEKEVENINTHPNVEKLLLALRPLLKKGTLGYTSFGDPEKHPNVPWKILDHYCDIAFPQIYFEKFNFKPTNEEEVQACLNAHQRMGLVKPILPIFGSESDTSQPGSDTELQQFLNNFPGSSIWRLPNVNEAGEAWKLTYNRHAVVLLNNCQSHNLKPPKLRRILRQGSIGEDVKILQTILNDKGFSAGEVDGEFRDKTKAAVIAFQRSVNLDLDREVATQTWKALVSSPYPDPGSGNNDVAFSLVKFEDVGSIVETGFFFPTNFGSRFAKPAISSNPKRWLGEAGQRARYIQDKDMPVIKDPQHRCPDQIRQVIEYFNVEDNNNARY
jgi:hypothetical protein